MISKLLAKQLKQLLEQERRCNHRGAGIVAIALHIEDLRTTAELTAAIQQQDFITLSAQSECRRYAAESGTDHQGLHQIVSKAG